VNEAKAHPHIDALWGSIREALMRDPHVAGNAERIARAEGAPAFLKQYVTLRRRYLRERLASLREHGGAAPVLINEVAAPAGGSPGWVELYNRSAAAVDLSRFTLTPDLRAPGASAPLPGRTLAPGERIVLMASGDAAAGPEHLPFQLSPVGGAVGLFPVGSVYDPADALYFGPRATEAYGRAADGEERLSSLRPTPGAPNQAL
jgi:spore coat protein H